MNKELRQFNKGFSLVEVILSVAIFAMFISALAGVYLTGAETSHLAGNRNKAIFISQQGLEAARSIRDEDPDSFANGTFGLDDTSGSWAFSGTSDTSDIFTREVTVSDYSLDVKEVSSTVTWQQSNFRSGEVVLTTLLSLWQKIGEAVGDWTSPVVESAIDAPTGINGYKVDANNTNAYITRLTNSSDDDFVSFDISDPSAVTIEDTISLDGRLSDVSIQGDYAYVGSNSNSAEITVVDISDPSNLSVADTLNLSASDDVYSLQAVGSYLYVTRNSGSREFTVVDISDPTNISSVATLNLSGRYRDIYVSGSYAYVVGDSNSQELVIINISIPAAPVVTSIVNLAGNNNPLAIGGIGTDIFIGRGNGQIISVDASNPLIPVITNSFDPGGAIRDIDGSATLDYIFVGGDTNTTELSIYDVSTPSSPVFVSSYDNTSNDINGVKYVPSLDVVVSASELNSAELIVIGPS